MRKIMIEADDVNVPWLDWAGITKPDITMMASLLIDETTDDSCISSLGSLEDAENVVFRMLCSLPTRHK